MREERTERIGGRWNGAREVRKEKEGDGIEQGKKEREGDEMK